MEVAIMSGIFIQLLIISLEIGSVYVLFSLGLTLIFGIMRVVNFAHGQFFAVSAILVTIFVPWLAGRGVPMLSAYLLATMAAMAVTVALGWVVYQFGLIRFLRDMEGAFILTLGLAMLSDGLMLSVFGGAPRPEPVFVRGTVRILDVAVLAQNVVVFGAAVSITGVLSWAMIGTKLGKALRAIASDHEAAMLQGIPYKRLSRDGFLIATALAGIAGALMAPISEVTPSVGNDYLMNGFMAVVVGGLGSVPGAILGALFIAVIEAAGGYYVGPSAATMAIFVMVIVVLLIRPRGLLGRA
jgi:branched-chain amino acid transport system permease protein